MGPGGHEESDTAPLGAPDGKGRENKMPGKKTSKKATKSKPEKDAVMPSEDQATEMIPATEERNVMEEESFMDGDEPAASETVETVPEAAESTEPAMPEPATPEPKVLTEAPEEPGKAEEAESAAPAPSTQDEAVTMPAVGQTLSRMYKGKLVKIDVTENGFLHEGTVYSSLSAAAKAITGYKAINGRAWFGIGKAPSRPRSSGLHSKIKKVDNLIGKLRDAVQDADAAVARGREELADAERQRAELAQQAAQAGE